MCDALVGRLGRTMTIPMEDIDVGKSIVPMVLISWRRRSFGVTLGPLSLSSLG